MPAEPEDEPAEPEDEEALWCEECHRLAPVDELGDGDRCPRCGNQLLEAGSVHAGRRRIPWTFKAMIVATIIYLGYRAYQGIAWIAHHV